VANLIIFISKNEPPKNPLNHKKKENHGFFFSLSDTQKIAKLDKIGPPKKKKKTTEISNLLTKECVGHQGWWWVTGSARGFLNYYYYEFF